MRASELKEELRKGKYIIAAFGKISLWDGIDRERTIHPNVFRALIKEGVLHEECIECGASEFTLKKPTEKEILEARVKELEQKINWWAYNLPILDCKNIINEMLTETGEGDDE